MRCSKFVFVGVVLAAFLAGCGGKVAREGITLSYSPPDVAGSIGSWEQPVHVVATDARMSRSICNVPEQTAADKAMAVVALGPFYGVADTSMRESPNQDFIGAFKVAMEERLANAGVKIATTNDGGNPTIGIAVKQISVGFDAASWIGQVAYDATVRMGEDVLCQESIQKVERAVNWAGPDSGQKALDEAFTAAINALDLSRCLSHLGSTSP